MTQVIWHYKTFEQLTPKELYKILQLRLDVFVIEQQCFYQDMDDKDFGSSHLWAEINGNVVAYARILGPGISYADASIGRVISNPAFRGMSLGKQLMENAIEIIHANFIGAQIRISAQAYLVRFYSNLGFKQVSEEYLEDDIPHIEMLRDS